MAQCRSTLPAYEALAARAKAAGMEPGEFLKAEALRFARISDKRIKPLRMVLKALGAPDPALERRVCAAAERVELSWDGLMRQGLLRVLREIETCGALKCPAPSEGRAVTALNAGGAS